MSATENALPEGWAWCRLDELAAPAANAITDGPFGSNLKTEHYTDEGPRVIRLQNVGDGCFIDARAHISDEHFSKLQKHDARPGDIVIAALGETLPRACLVPSWLGSAIVKADCPRLRPSPEISARYLVAALNSPVVRDQAAAIMHGIGRPRLNLGKIKGLRIPLPPREEQERISDTVERLFAAVDEGLAMVATTDRLQDMFELAIFRDAFTGRLTGVASNGDLPARWSVVSLATVATVTTGTTPPTKRRDYYGESGTPFVRPGMLTGATITPGVECLTAAGATAGRVVPAGSVLMQCLGFGLGRVGIADRVVAFNQQINASTFGDSVEPEYGLLYLRSMGDWVRRNATITLTPLLNKTRFMEMPFILPPRDEQVEIVNRLKIALDSATALAKGKREAESQAAALRRGILRAAVTGELTQQRSVDEPAEVLLDRIGRSAAMIKPKRGGVKVMRSQ